jgi:hypothetical protein
MFESAKIGDEFIFIKTGLKSKVLDKTSNSILMYNRAVSDKGIDSTNWYTVEWFERKFKRC